MATGSHDLLLALNRFGLGGRPGEPQRLASDPRAAVVAQLQRGRSASVDAAGLPTSQAALRANRLAEMQREREREAVAASLRAPTASMTEMAPPQRSSTPRRDEPPVETVMIRAEAAARFGQFAATESPLIERLALFWSNHFCVSVAKGGHVRACAGAYEREAIRPFVLGRFADMLKAVETHPAMLYYLDNTASVGPRSRNGRNSRRGLNENLAREILELHTLGVDGGYTQADVTSLARIITGWTVTNTDEDILHGGRFTFAPARHEPGPQVLLGATYDDTGLDQGVAALETVARHPATARHVARKLARHFVADDPPPPLVERLEKRFRDTEGDLYEVTLALVTDPDAWSGRPTKMRSPLEFVIAGLRATGRVPEAPQVLGWLGGLGQPLWQPPGPNGFPDKAAVWASPEGMAARLDLAAQWGRQWAQFNPRDLLDQVLGPAASAETRQAVTRAESRPQGLALLFMSPEFQRR